MDSPLDARIAALAAKIGSYGKENLEDILHVVIEALGLISRQNRCRIYLEDLTSGSLSCAAASGLLAQAIRQQHFPINSAEYMVSRVYISQEEAQVEDVGAFPSPFARELAERFAILSCYLVPLLHQGRAVGVACLDSSRKGQLPGEEVRRQLKGFLDRVVPVIDQARKYHQQMVLARRVDEAKKKEAAFTMVKSAVRLIDKLSLASVLVPSQMVPGAAEGGLQILASYSEEKEAKRLYEDERQINLGRGKSLLSRFINSAGVITDETLLGPLYIPNLPAETLQKRYLTEEMGLKSLYMVPRFEPRTRRLICLVNYYTREAHRFSDFEKGLLEAHAEMAQRVIQEIGGEHMEIQVLSEINDLLQEKFEGVQTFLNRVLSKATELIGADTGSIALVREQDGVKWLVVEEPDGRLVGAKSKEWLKKNIPPIRIGGRDLPAEERSLTGYVAHSGRPHVIEDTDEEKRGGGLYREITEVIKSEIAVPVVFDGEVIAVICLDSLRPIFFTDEHKRILLIIERMISRYLSDLQRIEKLTTEVNRLRSDVGYKDPKISSYKLGNIIGNSPKANALVEFIQRITPPIFNRIAYWSRTDVQEATLGLPSILVTGPTGSGKEFFFNNIFSKLNEMYQAQIDPRGELPVKKSNIAAYSGELTYSELFGHKRGAFTGAHTDRTGILEEAHGGVVFLDEIGDADPKTQVQLLRFLDNGGFMRLGDNVTRYARVLLIAATNKNLRQLIDEGLFREDLYHRLSELTIEVPSLNERREDIPDLAVHFLGKLYRVYKRPEEGDEDAPAITRGAQNLLTTHHYTGNIRELRSILLRALFFRRGRIVTEDDVREVLAGMGNRSAAGTGEKLTGELAREIFETISAGRADFWSGLHTPFSENRISRDVVAATVELARGQGATSMPKIAEALGACDPRSDSDQERKLFYKFKNFLYKTIRIS
ncbi:Fis family transcriptional regulator [Desulfuromonas versatilis]|uniref:Fis family transcriptional regulator n=1 Tax=Desulfuromonas versatilis TaxID=2802975 RepID=A0ABN6DU19_9BACT|nr:GPMC system transcriptional regulator [Desulfuromonas versatilis]BCR03486.1 Fis family transcriptional regulator [Desulfuromonas versatilis]